MELAGSKVLDIACGRYVFLMTVHFKSLRSFNLFLRCHTLVVVNNHKLYSFGLGGSGQLGLNRESKLIPTFVSLNSNCRLVFAGGDHSFVLCSKVVRTTRNIFSVSSNIFASISQENVNISSHLFNRKGVKHLNSERLQILLKKDLVTIMQ